MREGDKRLITIPWQKYVNGNTFAPRLSLTRRTRGEASSIASSSAFMGHEGRVEEGLASLCLANN